MKIFKLDLRVLEKSLEKINEKDLNSLFQRLLNETKLSLEMEPFQKNVKIIINKKKISKQLRTEDIFNIGVKRYTQNKNLIIEMHKDYLKFISFIILREIYNCFISDSLKEYESIQLVLNQIILTDLSNSIALNEWRKLIRGKLEQYDLLSGGFNRLIIFDRLEKFFLQQEKDTFLPPKRFFFHYLLKNESLITNKMDDFYEILLQEFANYISKSITNDEIIETIRCLIRIFYRVKNYKDLSSYKKYFQKFKENQELESDLSLRKFIKNMDWIKKYSFIAPSYQLNWNAINVCVIAVFLRFNPILKKSKIFSIIEGSPFFIATKTSLNSFSVELSGYVILPRPYLDDFIKFIKRLKSSNFITKSYCLLRTFENHLLNLNYLREYSQKYKIINPNHRSYDKKFEIEFQIDFSSDFSNPELSLLQFLIIDRIRFISVFGFGFEKRTETLATLKSDLVDEIITQRTLIIDLKDKLNKFYDSKDLQLKFLEFLNENKKFGFFYIKKKLEEYLQVLDFIKKIITRYPQVKTLIEFHDILDNQYHSHLIEDNIIFNSSHLKNLDSSDLISAYFKSQEDFKMMVENYINFHDLINIFYNLKLFNLSTIKKTFIDKTVVDNIYQIKLEKLEKFYEKFKLYQITSQEVTSILDKLLENEPPIINPLLINTINIEEYVNDFLQLILINSQETQNFLIKMKRFFPRITIDHSKEIISDKNLIYVEISTPYLTKKEKRQLFSILYNIFKENLLYGKFFLWTGRIKALSSKHLYDFDSKTFFYTKDLYEQYFLYVKSIFRSGLEYREEEINRNQKNFWSNEENILDLVKKVNDRGMSENCDYNDKNLNRLLDFHLNLKEYLINIEKFKNAKEEYFFTNFIKSIRFIPAFEYFGLGQYYLFLYPTDMNEIDFKLLLLNTFQKINYPTSIDNSNSLFINYIMPYDSPQLSYIHWLARSKNIIREYCGFFIKKVYNIIQFDNNLTLEGWNYDKDRFKMHMQTILFNPKYQIENLFIKEYEVGNKSISSYFGPESPEFESLSQIYNRQSIDIKSYLITKKVLTISHITSLLRKNLIFPYLSLKNLDLHNKVYIIVPNLKKEMIKSLVKVFSFFNLVHISEITGEYFIYGFDQEKRFPTGLMIKIYFPKCEISEFERLFDLLFEYLEVKDYLILNDLVDGNELIKSIYADEDLLKFYNPLKNLKWNEKKKCWKKPKVFTSKFEPIYPNLISKDKL